MTSTGATSAVEPWLDGAGGALGEALNSLMGSVCSTSVENCVAAKYITAATSASVPNINILEFAEDMMTYELIFT
jgi:hypothetical protein